MPWKQILLIAVFTATGVAALGIMLDSLLGFDFIISNIEIVSGPIAASLSVLYVNHHKNKKAAHDDAII